MILRETLAGIPVGARCRVKMVRAQGGDCTAMNRRLSELGLRQGAEVECVSASPLRDPRAYRICGCIIAIRGRDARMIEVERCR